MKKIALEWSTVILGCLFLVFSFSSPVFAQSNKTVATTSVSGVVEKTSYTIEKLTSENVFKDFVVGPGKFVLELSPGESKTVEMVVSNRMGERKRFSFTTEDMEGSNDPEQAVSLLGAEQGPYTLKDLITIPNTEFELDHAERARIPVTVTLPPDAEPGGRYGSLLVAIVSKSTDMADGNGTTPGSVVISRIGTLFFVTTKGDVEQNLSLVDFSTLGNKKFFTQGPIQFGIVSENKGSVHTTPYGEVRIYNTLGKEVGFVEIEPWFVMPNALRLREVAWDREFLVGRYSAVAKINRGYDDIVDEKTFTFWVIPVGLILTIFGVLCALFFIFYFIRTRFEFRRKQV